MASDMKLPSDVRPPEEERAATREFHASTFAEQRASLLRLDLEGRNRLDPHGCMHCKRCGKVEHHPEGCGYHRCNFEIVPSDDLPPKADSADERVRAARVDGLREALSAVENADLHGLGIGQAERDLLELIGAAETGANEGGGE